MVCYVQPAKLTGWLVKLESMGVSVTVCVDPPLASALAINERNNMVNMKTIAFEVIFICLYLQSSYCLSSFNCLWKFYLENLVDGSILVMFTGNEHDL